VKEGVQASGEVPIQVVAGPQRRRRRRPDLLLPGHRYGLGARVAVIDTDRGSDSKDASTLLQNFHPKRHIAANREAAAGRYDVIVIDSLSHAWAGTGGMPEIVDDAAQKSRSGAGRDTWSGRETATPIPNRVIAQVGFGAP
jgi:hypothetical protein